MENSLEEWGTVEFQQESGHEDSTEIENVNSFLFPPPEHQENKLDPIIEQMENSYKRLEKVLNAFNRMK